MVHFHARSDPDGVIHVSDEAVDYDPYDPEQNDYQVTKVVGTAGQQITDQVVDVTYVEEDTPRNLGLASDHRDPPTDKRAAIYDTRFLGNDGMRSGDLTEDPVVRPDPSTALSDNASVVRADPSMTRTESAIQADRSIIKSDPSIVRSDPSMVKSEDSMAFNNRTDMPVIYLESQEEGDVIDVESVVEQQERKRGDAATPGKPKAMTAQSQGTSPVWRVPSARMNGNQNEEAQPRAYNRGKAKGQAKAVRQSKLSSKMNASKPSPEIPRKLTTMPPPPPRSTHTTPEAISLLEDETLPVVIASVDVHDVQQEKEAVNDSRRLHASTAKAHATVVKDNNGENSGTSQNWIMSGIINTLACRGPEPVGSSGPMGLVSCGGTRMASTGENDAFDKENEEDANSVKGFDDLASLPSLDDSVVNGEEDNDSIAGSAASRISLKTEYVGAVVEKKIKNLEMKKLQGKEELVDEGEDAALRDQQIVQLVKEMEETSKSFGRYDIRCAHLSKSLAEKYSDRKAYKKALEYQRTVVAIYSTKLGDHHENTMDAKVVLGKRLEDVEEYDAGIACFYEVLAMRRSLKGERDPSTSDSLIQIANCLRKKGQYMQAIRELKRALKVYRDTLGDSHPSVASTVDEIASLYVTLGDFDKSAAILEEVVKLKAATLGMENAQVASSLVELATSYECSEDFERAVKALKKAYKIYTDLDGFSCEQATSTLHRIALLYQASGDINKAAIAYLGVLRGKKHLMGDDHLEVAETYYRLGVCLRETNQLDKALKCMKEALPILVGKGQNIHDVDMIAEVMHEMALLYKAKRQLGEAAKIFKQELTVRRKIGQPEYPCIAKTLNHLGVTEYEMKMHRKALKHLLEVLTIFQEKEEQGIDFAEALYNIGLVFEAVRNKERAYEAFLEAARVFKTNGYSNDHPHLVKAVNKVKRLAKR